MGWRPPGLVKTEGRRGEKLATRAFALKLHSMGKKAATGAGQSGKLTPSQRAKAESDAKKVIARNKKAAHDYFLEDRYEAGLSLTGTEVKALRMGRASLAEAWVEVDRGEAWLQGANIPEYFYGSWTNHTPKRKRKLLLHKREIAKLEGAVAAKGYTIVPVELYFVGGRAKVEIAVAKGKQEWDKRQTIRQREDDREAQRALREANRRSR